MASPGRGVLRMVEEEQDVHDFLVHVHPVLRPEIALADDVTLGVGYTGQFGDEATSDAVKATDRIAF